MYKKFEVGTGCDPAIRKAWYEFLDHHQCYQYTCNEVSLYLNEYQAITVITREPRLRQFLIFNTRDGYVNFMLKFD